MTRKIKIPPLSKLAATLFLICVAIIIAYLLCVIAYINYRSGDPKMPKNALEMLHSASISTVIALGGSFLLDCEIRYDRKMK